LGQLGLGDTTNRISPTEISFLNGKNITQLVTGYDHIFAISKEGKIYGFGYNGMGQLGLGDTSNRLTPNEVAFFNDKKIFQVAAGDDHSFAIQS